LAVKWLCRRSTRWRVGPDGPADLGISHREAGVVDALGLAICGAQDASQVGDPAAAPFDGAERALGLRGAGGLAQQRDHGENPQCERLANRH
jgi:hypothetical protein